MNKKIYFSSILSFWDFKNTQRIKICFSLSQNQTGELDLSHSNQTKPKKRRLEPTIQQKL